MRLAKPHAHKKARSKGPIPAKVAPSHGKAPCDGAMCSCQQQGERSLLHSLRGRLFPSLANTHRGLANVPFGLLPQAQRPWLLSPCTSGAAIAAVTRQWRTCHWSHRTTLAAATALQCISVHCCNQSSWAAAHHSEAPPRLHLQTCTLNTHVSGDSSTAAGFIRCRQVIAPWVHQRPGKV